MKLLGSNARSLILPSDAAASDDERAGLSGASVAAKHATYIKYLSTVMSMCFNISYIAPCTGATQDLLLRAEIIAGKLIPVGKETDRRWEQGEDPSLLDFRRNEYRTTARMAVASVSDRRRWKKIGARNLIRKSKLSQEVVYAILNGEPVRASTFVIFRRAIGPD